MYHSCQPRQKYCRRDPVFIPFPAIEVDGKLISYEDMDKPQEIGTLAKIGSTNDFEYFECTIGDRIVPVYRRVSTDGKDFCFCQDHSFKIAQLSAEKLKEA